MGAQPVVDYVAQCLSGFRCLLPGEPSRVDKPTTICLTADGATFRHFAGLIGVS